MASVAYCEQCKCRTLHVPMPSGESACEWHLDAPRSAPPEGAPEPSKAAAPREVAR